MKRFAVHGAAGRMGRAVIAAIAEDASASLVAELDRDNADASFERCDAVIDFSTPEATLALAERCAREGVALVTGTTGLSSAQIERIDAAAAKVPIVLAPNMSVGVTLLFHLAERAAKILGAGFDAEIVEMHHRLKEDAPSGTAVKLAERVAIAKGLDPRESVVHGRSGRPGKRKNEEIGVMALRGGTVIGDHTLVLAGASERLELSHFAQDRSIFARGAVRAAHWIAGKHPGRYDMSDVLGL